MADNEVIFAHEVGVERLDDDTVALTCRGDIAARMTNDAVLAMVFGLEGVVTPDMAAQIMHRAGQKLQGMLGIFGDDGA